MIPSYNLIMNRFFTETSERKRNLMPEVILKCWKQTRKRKERKTISDKMNVIAIQNK
jgi:hypothetical protein